MLNDLYQKIKNLVSCAQTPRMVARLPLLQLHIHDMHAAYDYDCEDSDDSGAFWDSLAVSSDINTIIHSLEPRKEHLAEAGAFTLG